MPLKQTARKAQPSMFKLVEIFKQEQSDTEAGSQLPKKFVDKDKKIGELKSRFTHVQL